MLISKTVKLKWNPKNKRYYESFGYIYTRMSDEFEVNPKHLKDGCNAIVDIQCDYCGTHYTKRWCNYVLENQNSVIHKDCCIKCRKYKIQESVMNTYGVNSVLSLPNIKDRIKETNIQKYGVENPFASEPIKRKIICTNLSRFGVKNPLQNKSILKKVSDTCEKRYGVKYYILLQKLSGSSSPVWKGGISRQRSERFTYDYIKWRKSVFIRDNYTCQCCGTKNSKGLNKTVRLNAHHIYNWKDYEEKRYSIENGITLCEKCHNKFHSIYGKVKNTNKQLNKFLIDHGKKVC